VTIVLTTHYIEEAEMMADRIALLNKGQIIFVENKESLMARNGEKRAND
jgi:ABC-2 type transport system ATP-binding protein